MINSDRPDKLQIIFIATGAFAVPSMQRICESGRYEVLCLVTNPVRLGQSGKPLTTPARQFAHQFNIPISEKEDVHSREFAEFLRLVRPDILFVCDFGHILPNQVLDGAILGGINLHGSLLPKYRGAAPVHWAILNDETYTGVSIIHMTSQVDAGPVIAQSPPIPIGPRETLIELEDRLAEYGAEMVVDTLDRMARKETLRIIPQLVSEVSKAPKFSKEFGMIDWTYTSRQIYNHYRALITWPKSFADWRRSDGSVLRLILGPILPLDDSLKELVGEEDYQQPIYVEPVLMDAKHENLAELRQSSKKRVDSPKIKKTPIRRPAWWVPGEVVRASGGELIVAAGKGAVQILEIQPPGKKPMSAAAFLNGYKIQIGDKLQ